MGRVIKKVAELIPQLLGPGIKKGQKNPALYNVIFCE